MGNMSKKHRQRVDNLEHELGRLEANARPTPRQEKRVVKLRAIVLPKARRTYAKS